MGNAPAPCCKCEEAAEGDLPVIEISAATKDPRDWSTLAPNPATSPVELSPRSTPRNSPKGSPRGSIALPRPGSNTASWDPSLASMESSSKLALPCPSGPKKSTSSLLSRGTTHTSEQSGTSRMSKLQRLNSLGHLHIDKELLCGLTIRKSLRSGGRAWMTMPKDMSHAQLVALHSKAEAMESFDFFLSHTWSTDGKWKVLSLLMQTGWPYAVICGTLAVGVSTLLCLNDQLPMPWCFKDRQGSVLLPLGCWISVSSLLGLLLGLFISPYFPCFNGRPGRCFIDMVSIDQSDPEKIEEGIYGIGGFLSVSRELQVLWSPPYLSRLWCVFELAAYRKANPSGKITLTPLYVEQLLTMMIIGLYVVLVCYWVANALNLSGVTSTVVYVVAMIPASIPLHLMRRNLAESKHKLLADLKDFDIKQVHCLDDFDRSFIHSAIIKWYGSREAFTDFVRGPLRDELLKDSPSSLTYIPFGYALLLGFVCCSMSWEYMVSYMKAGSSTTWIASYLVGTILAYNLIWTVLALRGALYLCDRLARRSPACLDYLKTALCWMFLCVWQVSGAMIQELAKGLGLQVCIAWFGVTLCLSAVSWRLSR